MKNKSIQQSKMDILIMRLTYFFVMRIGITWNNIFVPILFNALPGVGLWLATYITMNIVSRKFDFSTSFTDYAFHPIVLGGLLVYLVYMSIKKYNKVISVKERTLVRFEYQGQGFITQEGIFSHRAARDAGKDFTLTEFAMINEGKRILPWFTGISDIQVPDKSVPLQLTTERITTTSANGVQINCVFSERYHVFNPGLYFNIAAENTKHQNKIEILTNAILDLIQKVDDSTILWLSGKQIKKILLERISYKDETTGEHIELRDKIKHSIEEDYARHVKLKGAQKVIQDFYQSKLMWLELKIAQNQISPEEEQEKRKEISLEFEKFKDAIVSSIGRIKHLNDRFGLFTDDIIQKEMNYGSEQVQKAAEQRIMTQLQAEADSIRVQWLTDTMKSIQESWKDGSLTAKDALHTIQVEFGKRTGYTFDGSKDITPMVTIK